jgi:ankyrin repeat protein
MGHAEMVRVLLNRNADPNARTTRGQTALDVAREAGHRNVVDLLRKRERTLASSSAAVPGKVNSSDGR